ncbi:MAG: ABC transporter permease [Candidatus Thorarchaeota archaeon]
MPQGAASPTTEGGQRERTDIPPRVLLDWRAARIFAEKNLMISLRYPANIIVWGVVPILWLAPYVLMMTALSGSAGIIRFQELSGFDDFVKFAIVGWFVYQYVDNAIWSIGNNFRWEQFSGTLEPLFVAPVSRVSILLGAAISDTVFTTLSAVVLLGTSCVLFGVSYSFVMVAPVILTLLLMLFALFGFGFMVAGLILVFKDPSVLTQLVDTVAFTVTPVNYPVQALPPYARFLAYLIPATIAMEVIRHLLIDAYIEMSVFLTSIMFLLLLLVGFWVVGLAAFRYAERWTKERGSMGGF